MLTLATVAGTSLVSIDTEFFGSSLYETYIYVRLYETYIYMRHQSMVGIIVIMTKKLLYKSI